jgi:hypothetical protein
VLRSGSRAHKHRHRRQDRRLIKHLIGFWRDRREAIFLYVLFAAVRWSLMALRVISLRRKIWSLLGA